MTGKLKHVCIIVCIAVLALLFSACSGDIPTSSEDGSISPEGGSYRVESNIDVIGDNRPVVSRSLSVIRVGDEIVGVLLDYNDEDPNVFYLEFNDGGEIRQNGDGMK